MRNRCNFYPRSPLKKKEGGSTTAFKGVAPACPTETGGDEELVHVQTHSHVAHPRLTYIVKSDQDDVTMAAAINSSDRSRKKKTTIILHRA